MGFAELLLRRPDLPKDTAQSYVQLINTAARDATAVIRRLRELYRERSESTPDAPVDIRRCVDEVVALTQPRWKSEALGRGITIQVATDIADVPVILGDAAAIREMLANLILNAVAAMPEGGTITVRARCESGDVRLEVKDTGPGMSNGREGLDKFMSGRFDLVVTDRAMPEMGGDELAASIEQLSPDTPVIMLTGFGDLMEAKGEQPAGVDAVVGKPVTLDALAGAIRQVRSGH